MFYRLRRSTNPALESVPPPSSIISHPAEVLGISRLALFSLDALVFEGIVLACVLGGRALERVWERSPNIGRAAVLALAAVAAHNLGTLITRYPHFG